MKHIVLPIASVKEIKDIAQEYNNDVLITFYISDIEIIKETIRQNVQIKYFCILNNDVIDSSVIKFLVENNIGHEIQSFKTIPSVDKKVFEYDPELKICLTITKAQASEYIALLQQLHNLHFKNISIIPDFCDTWDDDDWAILNNQIKYYCDFLGQRLYQTLPYVRLFDFENMCKKILYNNLKCLTQHEPDYCNLIDSCPGLISNEENYTINCQDCACNNICNFIITCNKVKINNKNNINQCKWNKILFTNILYFFAIFESVEQDDEFVNYIEFLLKEVK